MIKFINKKKVICTFSLILFSTIIGLLTTIIEIDNSIQILVLLLLLIIGVGIGFFVPNGLPTYIVLIWVISPEIRRILDWIEGGYNPISIISLAPLIVTCLLFVPLTRSNIRISNINKKIIISLLLAFSYAIVLGVLRNGFSAFYEMGNYVVPVLLFVYFSSYSSLQSKLINKWLKSLVNVSILFSIYAWIQFVLVPPWDALWMKSVNMSSIGIPEPFEVRVFSTLNAPLAAGVFLATSLIILLVHRNQGGRLGIISTILIISALALTLVRTAWLMVIIAVISYFALNSSKSKLKLLINIIIILSLLYFILPKIPGYKSIDNRIQSFNSIESDYSLNVRLEFTQSMFRNIISNPIGKGFGGSGASTKLGNDGQLGENGNFDNGFLNILFTFGILGSYFFFYTFYLIFRRLMRLRKNNFYVQLSIAFLISIFVSLISYNLLPGIGGILFWLLISIGLNYKKNDINNKLYREGN